MADKFFSIGIPVYNAEKYLAECLDSILTQGFKDYEIILVDDGSKDSSRDICMQYAEKNSCIKYFYKENGGISSACNMLLDNIQGRYFFQMDNDDTMCDNCLQNAYDEIVKNNYPDVLQCGYRQFSYSMDNLVTENIYKPIDDNFLTDNFDLNTLKMYINVNFANPLWTKFIRTEFIKKHGIRFNSSFDSAQDSDFTLQCFRKTKHIGFGQFYTVNWIHPRSESVSSTRKFPQFKRLMDYHHFYINDIKGWSLTDEEKRKMTECFTRPMRGYTLEVFQMPKEDVIKTFEIADRYFGEEFRKLPILGDSSIDYAAKIIYIMYNLIGMKNTAKILYFYLHKIKKT